jgi:hypothetical protein
VKGVIGNCLPLISSFTACGLAVAAEWAGAARASRTADAQSVAINARPQIASRGTLT